ncbi:ABC transporter ATP-binding protein [bacterium]|nr:ABC transporter ATP-binding protein [bacterium]
MSCILLISNMKNLLDVKNLNLGFETQNGFYQAIFDVSFSLKEGASLAIVGESGCGKSISTMSILGLLPKTAKIIGGEILYKNNNLLKLNESELRKIRGSEIALIPQDPMTALNPLYTIGNQLLEVINLHQHLSGEDAKKKAIEALDTVQIPSAKERLNSYPHEFSGGMRQRAIIAMALACEAKIIIADEPTTALDVTIQAQIMSLLDEIKKETDTSILLITHDLALVKDFADEVSVMYAGEIVENANVNEFFNNTKHPYSKALLEAIPSKTKGELSVLKGQPPALNQIISGCRFNPRCKFAQEVCKSKINSPQNKTGYHYSKCIFFN